MQNLIKNWNISMIWRLIVINLHNYLFILILYLSIFTFSFIDLLILIFNLIFKSCSPLLKKNSRGIIKNVIWFFDSWHFKNVTKDGIGKKSAWSRLNQDLQKILKLPVWKSVGMLWSRSMNSGSSKNLKRIGSNAQPCIRIATKSPLSPTETPRTQ